MKPAALRVQAAIRELGIEGAVVELPVHARTSQQAADALGVALGRIVKSLVFLADGRIVDYMDAPTPARVLERMKAFGG